MQSLAHPFIFELNISRSSNIKMRMRRVEEVEDSELANGLLFPLRMRTKCHGPERVHAIPPNIYHRYLLLL